MQSTKPSTVSQIPQVQEMCMSLRLMSMIHVKWFSSLGIGNFYWNKLYVSVSYGILYEATYLYNIKVVEAVVYWAK